MRKACLQLCHYQPNSHPMHKPLKATRWPPHATRNNTTGKLQWDPVSCSYHQRAFHQVWSRDRVFIKHAQIMLIRRSLLCERVHPKEIAPMWGRYTTAGVSMEMLSVLHPMCSTMCHWVLFPHWHNGPMLKLVNIFRSFFLGGGTSIPIILSFLGLKAAWTRFPFPFDFAYITDK